MPHGYVPTLGSCSAASARLPKRSTGTAKHSLYSEPMYMLHRPASAQAARIRGSRRQAAGGAVRRGARGCATARERRAQPRVTLLHALRSVVCTATATAAAMLLLPLALPLPRLQLWTRTPLNSRM